MNLIKALMALSFALLLTACAPEVGSEKWCQQLEDKPKGEWTSNEAGNYAKHCIFRSN